MCQGGWGGSVSDAMVAAGAKVLVDLLEAAPYASKYVAREVFIRMAEAGDVPVGVPNAPHPPSNSRNS